METVEEFLSWCQRDRGRSMHTIRRYERVLVDLGRFVDGGDPLAATLDDVETWWTAMYDLAPASRANALASARSFYRWAAKFDHRPDDPTRRLDAPKIPNKVPRPVGESDLTRLLGPLTEDAPDVRRAIALGALAGMRVSEAAALDWADVDLEARRIYVRGKGQKERVFGLSPVLLDKLLPELAAGNVVTAGGKPHSAPTLQRRINRLMAANGIDKTYHDLRKRAATLAMAKVKNPIAVANAFGWSSIQTATAYAYVGDEVLDEIAAAVV